MKYYEVLVSSQRFHGHGALTYRYEGQLQTGQPVIVPLQRQKVVGIVKQAVSKPAFKARPIARVVSSAPMPTQTLSLINWLAQYYPAPLGSIVSLLLPASLTQESRKKNDLAAAKDFTASPLPPLTKEQTEVVATIEKGQHPHFLLHGDTGSGKTRVYLELATKTLAKHQSVMLLTPEIGLTPQLTDEAKKVFGDAVVVLHSNLSPAQRRNTWLRILESRSPLVIIGPRSALFSPLHRVGLIILDEFHDTAYKQEQAPHYLATRVAAKLASLHQAKLVLGSATPLVSDYYAFQHKKLPILRMSQSAKSTTAQTHVEVVDLTERDNFTRSPWLSNTLLQQIDGSLSRKEQSLVFLNRRGTARLIICQNCAWQALCPRCDLPLTYHGDHHKMRCHTCGFSESAPANCPACKSTEVTFKSVGTKALYDELTRLYPKARIARFDSDSYKAESLQTRYSDLRDGKMDIIVGTQLLSKGLDLPKLGVVGVVVADTGLHFPDYTAEERTYQMLSQIIGRVNRGHIPGTVVLQTYHPKSTVIQAAINKDFDSFYQQQIKERETYRFPPFYYILKIRCERATKSSAQNASHKVAQILGDLKLPIQITGPTPAFTEKVNNKFRWQLIVRSKNRQSLVNAISHLPANCTYDIDPTDLL